jgi:hypothetical protein
MAIIIIPKLKYFRIISSLTLERSHICDPTIICLKILCQHYSTALVLGQNYLFPVMIMIPLVMDVVADYRCICAGRTWAELERGCDWL